MKNATQLKMHEHQSLAKQRLIHLNLSLLCSICVEIQFKGSVTHTDHGIDPSRRVFA